MNIMTLWPNYGSATVFQMDIMASDYVLGYSVSGLFDTSLQGMPNHESIAREYRCGLLFQVEKAPPGVPARLFRRYASSLPQSPGQWFRMRDCDVMVRFTIIAALVSNDVFDAGFSEKQLKILTELGITMYDAVSFYKHRSSCYLLQQ
ncbi:hypothetical protein B0H19DRAFT_1262538 [Mycena capillaripes]|nr:hypothetical protein B0H19DRAFT_1262538 [Mycena capillaripes]